jgi:hypothetical protein
LGNEAMVLTMHDYVYCEPQHRKVVLGIMTEVLTAATGFVPNIKSSTAEAVPPSTNVLFGIVEQSSDLTVDAKPISRVNSCSWELQPGQYAQERACAA